MDLIAKFKLIAMFKDYVSTLKRYIESLIYNSPLYVAPSLKEQSVKDYEHDNEIIIIKLDKDMREPSDELEEEMMKLDSIKRKWMIRDMLEEPRYLKYWYV